MIYLLRVAPVALKSQKRRREPKTSAKNNKITHVSTVNVNVLQLDLKNSNFR